MKTTLAFLLLALLSAGCGHKITAPMLTLDSALAAFDWERHTEPEFWAQYPQFRIEYELRVVRMSEVL